MFFKKRKKDKVDNGCEHVYKELGKSYEVFLTEYKNRFDTISIAKIYYCSKCKEWTSKHLGLKEFIPSMHNISSRDTIKDYIKELESKGVISAIEMNEKLYDLKIIGSEEVQEF